MDLDRGGRVPLRKKRNTDVQDARDFRVIP